MKASEISSMPNEETKINDDGADSTIFPSLNSDLMKPMNDGPNELSTATESIARFTEELETYLKNSFVPVVLPRHIDHYLNMPRSELSGLSSQDIGEMAFEIYSHVYRLQRIYNFQLAKADVCRFEIDKIIGPKMDKYKNIYGKDEKRLAAISENTPAWNYRKIETYARAAATSMSYLMQRLEIIAKCLESIAKRRENA